MASQVVCGNEPLEVFEIKSFVRSHAYQDLWSPQLGEVLPIKREPTNPEDKFAVAVKLEGRVVGHLPFNIAPTVSCFLNRNVNKGIVEVTGERINRGAGYGLEIPCKYRLYGPKKHVDTLRKYINKLYCS